MAYGICHKLSVFGFSKIRNKKNDIFQFKPRIELPLPPTTQPLASGHKHAHTRKQRQSKTNTQTIITNKHEAIKKFFGAGFCDSPAPSQPPPRLTAAAASAGAPRRRPGALHAQRTELRAAVAAQRRGRRRGSRTPATPCC